MVWVIQPLSLWMNIKCGSISFNLSRRRRLLFLIWCWTSNLLQFPPFGSLRRIETFWYLKADHIQYLRSTRAVRTRFVYPDHSKWALFWFLGEYRRHNQHQSVWLHVICSGIITQFLFSSFSVIHLLSLTLSESISIRCSTNSSPNQLPLWSDHWILNQCLLSMEMAVSSNTRQLIRNQNYNPIQCPHTVFCHFPVFDQCDGPQYVQIIRSMDCILMFILSLNANGMDTVPCCFAFGHSQGAHYEFGERRSRRRRGSPNERVPPQCISKPDCRWILKVFYVIWFRVCFSVLCLDIPSMFTWWRHVSRLLVKSS